MLSAIVFTTNLCFFLCTFGCLAYEAFSSLLHTKRLSLTDKQEIPSKQNLTILRSEGNDSQGRKLQLMNNLELPQIDSMFEADDVNIEDVNIESFDD